MKRNIMMIMQSALMLQGVAGSLYDRPPRQKTASPKKEMSLYERELHRVEIERRRKARLKAFVVKGKTIWANSRKDAIKRYNHQK